MSTYRDKLEENILKAQNNQSKLQELQTALSSTSSKTKQAKLISTYNEEKYNEAKEQLQQRLSSYDSTPEKKKSVLRSGLAGVELLGQGALKGVEATFIDTPLLLASLIRKAFGDEEGSQSLAEFSNWDLTNMLINKAGGKETNPYINNNVNLYNKEELNPRSYITDENIGGQVVQGIGEMLPAIAIGGLGKTEQAAKLLGYGMLGTRAYSSGTNEAYAESGDILKSSLYGAASAGVEIGTENLDKLLGIAGTGIPGLRNLEKEAIKSPLKNYAMSVLGEGMEEMVSSLVNPVIQQIYKGQESLGQYVEGEYWKDLATSGLVGAITGGVLDSPNLIIGESNARTKKQSLNKTETEGKGTSVKPNIEEETKSTLNYDKTYNTTAEERAARLKQAEQVTPKTVNENVQEEVTTKTPELEETNKLEEYKENKETKEKNEKIDKGLEVLENIEQLQKEQKKPKKTTKTKEAEKITIDNKTTTEPLDLTKAQEQKVEQLDDYKMSHRPSETGMTADNLLGENSVAPKDIYDHPEYYSLINKTVTKETMDQLNKIRNNPDAKVTIYRATTGDSINNGDWVSLSKSYAEQHNYSQLDGKGNVISQVVNAKDVQWAGDDLAEWGYYPQETSTQQTQEVEKPKTVKETMEDQLKKIESDNKTDFMKKLQKQGIGKTTNTKKTLSKNTTVTPEQLATRKASLEMSAKTFDREISKYRTDSKKLNEWLENKIKVYDKYINDGGESIEAYEKLAMKYHVNRQAEKVQAPKENKTFTEKTQKAIDQAVETKTELDNISSIGNYIVGEQIGLNDQNEFIGDILQVNMGNSRINTKYNEKQNIIKEANKPLNKALNKNQNVELETYQEIQTVKENYETSQTLNKQRANKGLMKIKQFIVDALASLRELDTLTKSNKVMNAYTQASAANVLATQGIKGDFMIDDQYKVTKIPGIEHIFEPLTNLGTENYTIGEYYILLQMDYFNKVNEMQYNADSDDSYVNNLFPDFSADDILEELSAIKQSNPSLVDLVDTKIMPNVRRATRLLNEMEIRAGVRNAISKVSIDFAKNEMGLSDDYIKANKTKSGKVKVNTADYYSAANPYYIPISREVGINTTSSTAKAERGINKPFERKLDANKYDIQPLADGFAEKYMMRMTNIQNNKLRVAIANAVEQIDGVKAQEYTTKEGETGYITSSGNGEVQMRYLVNDKNGNLVNKVVSIDQNIADAYNGLPSWLKDFKQSGIGKVLDKTAKVRKNVLTKWNPAFQIKNVIVDFGDAIMNNELGLKGNAELIKNELGAYLIDLKNGDPIAIEFDAFKGDILTKTQTKGYIQNETGIKKVLNKLDNLLEVGELITRYAGYKTYRLNGYDVADAQRLTNSLTTEFGKTGLGFKMLDYSGATVFLSTSMAGLNRFYDSMIKPVVDTTSLVYNKAKSEGIQAALNKSSYDAYDKKTINRLIQQTIKTSLIFGLGRTILKELFDDEDKQRAIANLSDAEIQNNLCIPLGENSVLKIPKGRIWRSMDAIQDVLTNSTIRDTDKMGVIDTLIYVNDNVGVNDLTGSLTVSGVVDIIKNRDYYGNEIYKSTDSEGEKIKDIGDYLAKQYGSWIYKTIKYMNGGTEINPYISNFYTDTTTVSSYNTRFFNMKDAYENTDDVTNSYKYKVANYERSYGELSTEIKKLKTLKEGSASVDDIRAQEDKVKALYKTMFDYIDNNDVVQVGDEIRIGTNYTYKKQKDGSYKKVSKSKK